MPFSLNAVSPKFSNLQINENDSMHQGTNSLYFKIFCYDSNLSNSFSIYFFYYVIHFYLIRFIIINYHKAPLFSKPWYYGNFLTIDYNHFDLIIYSFFFFNKLCLFILKNSSHWILVEPGHHYGRKLNVYVLLTSWDPEIRCRSHNIIVIFSIEMILI